MWGTTVHTLPAVTMRLPSSEPNAVTEAHHVTLYNIGKRQWSYRGEGNANLVLSVPSEQRIVRLRKCPRDESPAEAEARIWREVEFCRDVMRPLLGERYVHVPEVVRIPKSDLNLLKNRLDPLRPTYRHHKSEYGDLAALFPDLCLLPPGLVSSAPTFCVEVKPKQGWIPPADRRLQKCTFCLNQFLKIRTGIISQRSNYCPLNLFSGDIIRMKAAIFALLQSPQNNFKMFRDGFLEFGENMPSYLPILKEWFGEDGSDDELVDNLCTLVVRALTANSSDFGLGAFCDDTWTQFSPQISRIPQSLLDKARDLINEPTCFQPCQPLPSGSILSRILYVQQLDSTGSDEVYRQFSMSTPDEYDYVSTLLRDPPEIFQPMHSYLLATTAKDCSILIAFNKIEDFDDDLNILGPTVQDSNGAKYVFSIGVSDLDPKPMSCIEKHKKRDLDVITSCIDYLDKQQFSINQILYQRGIYPPETFEPAKEYGITILMSTDPKIKTFLDSVLDQAKEWILAKKVKKMSLIIKNLSTKETLECWDFDVQYENGSSTVERGLSKPLRSVENTNSVVADVVDKPIDTGNKDINVIQREIRAVMLQICSTISFLPYLDCLCSFDVLVYTHKDLDIPNEWGESEPCFIANSQHVQFKPFSTSLHRVDTAVTYKANI